MRDLIVHSKVNSWVGIIAACGFPVCGAKHKNLAELAPHTILAARHKSCTINEAQVFGRHKPTKAPILTRFTRNVAGA